MSSTTSSTTEQAAVRTARLADLIEERLPPERAAAVGELAQAYVRRLSSEAAAAPQVEALLHEIVGVFDFAGARGREPVAVRAFNPTTSEHGYETPGSVLETNTEDLPFLVDSVTGEIERRGLGIARVVHPIVGVERDRERRIVAVLPARAARLRESIMHFDLERRLSDEDLRALEDAVRGVLGDVRRVVRDFNPMRERIERMVEIARTASAHYPLDEIDEITAFLVWLLQEHFVFLGYREYEIANGKLGVVADSGLGLLDDPSASSLATPRPLEQLDAGMRARIDSGELLDVTKTNRVSPVHRPARMDYVGVRRVNDRGEITGEARLIGLFTTNAYSEPASQTPLLRGKLRRIIEAEELIEGSHDYKAVVSLFDSFPKDELLAAPIVDLRRAVVALLGLYGDTVRLLGRRDTDGRSASAIAALPAERYNPQLADWIRELLVERFATPAVEPHLVLSEPDRVQIHYSIHSVSGQLPVVSFRALQLEVVALARSWNERLRERLTERRGAERGRALAARWASRLPEAYKASTHARYAAHDVECLDRLEESEESFVVGLQNASGTTGERTRVGLYKHGGKVELSSFLPILEALGLRVYEELPTRIVDREREIFIQDFGVLGPDGKPVDLATVAERVAACIAAVWRGTVESDRLNRLIVTAGLDWRQVAILRGYRRYRQLVGSRFSHVYEEDAFAANPEIVAKLVRLFELRFDPQQPRDEAAEEALHAEIEADLDAVESLDADRILRDHLRLLDATLRTNAFRGDRKALAIKLRSSAVAGMPQPAPLFEIFVYSPEMEGIHLRGGSVARGGIRWSDRMDYRTEVFGLMRAQMTKNAVIVPTGAKGGFILKRPPADRAAIQDEVARQYVTYIRSLLDLTDNRVDGKIVHPPAMRVLDDDDPYLVVAADKGTATFSDAANVVAAEQGFWLEDAFAAGGSAGYDHKALGITARGAWESVKRHFRELGLDPETDAFTAVGIGDMSGDVFGNGMLLSQRIRLVAAYDHRHVFIDPSPDPAAAFEERKRLFELGGRAPGCSWDDYDRARISAGGGVWPRKAKSIPLSEEARAALGVEAAALPPAEVIRAILRAPVDLLWNGGIGTVVKASSETHAAARDRASDQIRVDARELRCRVVAEGGNLGFTQPGRIEFAGGGGLIAADFIDNSAGVDCSDHEVNLKILLGLAERRGELTRADRDALLEEVTDDVVAHVLYDSFEQAQILSQEVVASADRMDAYEDLIALLERSGLIDREADALPSTQELVRRRRAGQGMLRPELAVLLAHAKRSLTEKLEASDLPDEPYLERELTGYFPAQVVERFGHLLAEHPLRRELIATIVAGDVLDALGSTFVARLMAERGAGAAGIVRAFRIARDVARAGVRWRAIERLGRSVPADVQDELMTGVDQLVEALARWYLAEMPGADLGPTIAAAQPAFDRLRDALAASGSEARRRERDEVERRLFSQGVPPELARDHALGPELHYAPDIIAVAGETGRPVEDVAEAFVAVGERLGIARCDRAVAALPVAERAERWARQALRDDVLHARRELARRALAEGETRPAHPASGDRSATGKPPAADSSTPRGDATAAAEAFLAARPHARRRLELFVQPLGGAGGTDLASVTLAVRELRALAEA